MEKAQEIEYELSKRNNVRKFNHKVPNTKNDLGEIFETKKDMNNSSPNILPDIGEINLKNCNFLSEKNKNENNKFNNNNNELYGYNDNDYTS